MKDKKENKTFILVLIGIIGLCLITIGLTYAYWILTKQQTGENVVNTACLNINFTGENDITLDKAYPMNNEQLESFLSTATPYHFTIENACDDLTNVTINLESLNAETDKQLRDEYINAILYRTDYHTNLNSEKKLIESIYNDENKVLSNALHAYKLYNFVLSKGESKDFNLLLYMDQDTPMDTANMNATWKGKITLSSSYKEEKKVDLAGENIQIAFTDDGLYEVTHENLEELENVWNQTEYRYAGVNPNNYVSFNNEIWRIVGMVNVKTKTGIEQRLKIVRTDGVNGQKIFGYYAWDKTGSDYTNNWTTSKLKDMLNGIYYESGTGDCYNSAEVSQCDFNSGEELPKGLDSIARNMVDKEVIWNLGGYPDSILTANEFYEKERGTITDNEYPAEWSNETDVGEKHNGVGLLYSSDYGYAVGGEIRNVCLTTSVYKYGNGCYQNDWLKNTNRSLWLLSPVTNNLNKAFRIHTDYCVYNGNETGLLRGVWPSLYLKQTVKITENPTPEQPYGTVDNPFQLSNE